MHRLRVLVIEDDHAIRRGLVDALRFASFEVIEADNGRDGLALASTAECDLVLLDLLLPALGDGDGLTILARVRELRPTLPVIILTARGDEADRVRGLQLGADDYVVKPFSVRELMARVQAVLRRSPQRPLDDIRLDGIEVDLNRRELRFSDGQRVELSEKEADLLRYLAQHASRAVSREELLQNVWLLEPQGLDTRTVDMHVARLRSKLRDEGSEPRLLLTVRGKGYMLARTEKQP